MVKRIAAGALAARLFASLLVAPVHAQNKPGSPIDLSALFATAGAMYGVDPSLLAAIATVESDDRSRAISPAGAMGLMQLMPATARRFRVGDAFDPVECVLGATRFLAYLQQRQRVTSVSDLPALIAAYNAGEGAVERYRGVPPYPETVHYVGRVLWHYLLDQPVESEGKLPAAVSTLNQDAALLAQLANLRRARSEAGEPRASRQKSRGAEN